MGFNFISKSRYVLYIYTLFIGFYPHTMFVKDSNIENGLNKTKSNNNTRVMRLKLFDML